MSDKVNSPTWESDCGTVKLWLGDCLEVLKSWSEGAVNAVVTDPPYGMGKADWDAKIPEWLPLAERWPVACFCGVIGERDYPAPDWMGAWMRQGSTQRNGKLRGFNNWEPILFYRIDALDNDVIAVPNNGGMTKHPTEKPERLMVRLVAKMPAGTIADPFMGSGTTGVAAARLGRQFWGVEIDPEYFEIAKRRIQDELRKVYFLEPQRVKDRQATLFSHKD